MRSPRFDFRSQPLRAIFGSKNLERVWRKKVRISLRQQILSDGVEHMDFHLQCANECAKLSAVILAGDYVPTRPLRVLQEKSKGLCRQLVIPNVADALVLQCLSDALFRKIKDKAPTKKAFFEPQNHSFSADRPRDEYGTFAAWLNFQQALFSFSKERQYIVVTDVANYYDSISYEHLRNVISSISDVDECVLDMLIYVLSHLLWQPDYTPRVEIGLPQMNLDAPRLLAHCLLYELDKFIDTQKDHDFVRFMDDIDIGVDDLPAARRVLRSIDLVLQTRQLRLNSGKTKILTQAAAEQHFRIKENAELDKLGADLDASIEAGDDLGAFRATIASNIRQGLRRGVFDSGNGDKILKRWIGLAAKTEASIAPASITEVLLNRPGVRASLLRCLSVTGITAAQLKALADGAVSGHLVDDAALVDMANALVSTRFSTKRDRDSEITRLIEGCDIKTSCGLYARLWLQSKFDPQKVIRTISMSRNTWAPSEHLGRVIGSFAPFMSEDDRTEFIALLVRTRNPGFRSVLAFHQQLAKDLAAFNGIFPALRAPNHSLSTGITHSKFLCLLSVLKNEAATEAQKASLRNANAGVLADVYYRKLIALAGIEWPER